jgi:hypothetical protein
VSTDVSEEHIASIFRVKKSGGKVFTCFHAGILLSLFFDPEDGGDMFLRNFGFTFNGLQGVISQKLILLITTAVKTSNPTLNNSFPNTR